MWDVSSSYWSLPKILKLEVAVGILYVFISASKSFLITQNHNVTVYMPAPHPFPKLNFEFLGTWQGHLYIPRIYLRAWHVVDA